MPSITPPSAPSPRDAAMSRVDGCPACVANLEAPHDVLMLKEGYKAFYRCADCGWSWSTAWKD